MSTGTPSRRFVFSSPAGSLLVRRTVQTVLGYSPHDYQLQGVCSVLDGSDLIAVLPTGAGKTSYYTVYMLMLLAISRNPQICSPMQARAVPLDPCIVMVYPTNGLEEEQAATFEKAGIQTLVINGDTLSRARLEGRNLWVEAQTDVSVILLSPEQLASPGFDSLLQQPLFQARLCCLGVDEIHLLYSWGQQFRKSYRQVGLVRARLPSRTRLIGTTATLLVGHPQDTVLAFLGLSSGGFSFIRRSNIRRSVRTIWRNLSRGLGGWVFPDLKWVLKSGRKTVIHCRTIALAFRVGVYLWHLSPPGLGRLKYLRLYHALNPSTYNTETRRLLREDPETRIVIATASFMVGIDLPNIADIVILGNLQSADEHVQWEGRAGRDPKVVSDARCITYVTKKALQTAHTMCEGDANTTTRAKKTTSASKKSATVVMDLSMAKLLTAPCATDAQNTLYGNPSIDPPCTCATCRPMDLDSIPTTPSDPTAPVSPPALASLPSASCDCSGCLPEEAPDVCLPKRKADNPVPPRKRLTKIMRASATKRLQTLRRDIYQATNTSTSRALPPDVFLPDTVIKYLLDRFALIETKDFLRKEITGRVHLLPHLDSLWTVLQELHRRFEGMRKKKAHAAAAPRTTRVKAEPKDDRRDLQAIEESGAAVSPEPSGSTVAARPSDSVTESSFQVLLPSVHAVANTSQAPSFTREADRGFADGLVEWKIDGFTQAAGAGSGAGSRKRPGTSTQVNPRPRKTRRSNKENVAQGLGEPSVL